MSSVDLTVRKASFPRADGSLSAWGRLHPVLGWGLVGGERLWMGGGRALDSFFTEDSRRSIFPTFLPEVLDSSSHGKQLCLY